MVVWEISTAEEIDVPSEKIVEFYSQYSSSTEDHIKWASDAILATHRSRIYVAYHKREMLGLILVDAFSYLRSLVVAPEHRRNGIARALVARAAEGRPFARFEVYDPLALELAMRLENWKMYSTILRCNSDGKRYILHEFRLKQPSVDSD